MVKSRMKGVTSITVKGSVYWYARIDGRKKYCGKGDKGRKLAEAAKAKDIARSYERKEVSAGLRVKRYDLKTVKDLLNWYMTIPEVQELRGYGRYLCAEKPLFAYFAELPVQSVEADDIDHYRHFRRQQGLTHATINLEVALLQAAYRRAVKRKKIPVDSTPGEFPRIEGNNPRPRITDEQFEAILEHCKPDFADFMICGYESAMRSSEIANLKPKKVRLGVRHISGEVVDCIDLGVFDTKTGARRTVPVSPRLKEVLERRLEGLNNEDRLFTIKGSVINGLVVAQNLQPACEAAGVPYGDKTYDSSGQKIGIVFHCLRHTRASKWVEQGFSDEIIRRATGHASMEAYRQYIKLDPSVVMRLVAKRDKNGIKSSQTRAVGG